MKQCPNCKLNAEDDRLFCEKCGTKLEAAPTPQPQPEPPRQQFNYNARYQPPQYQPVPPVEVDEYDHTSEFDPAEIADNKLIAAVVYLLGVAGIVIALLAAKDSKYVMFHVKQELKFIIVSTLVTMAIALLSWTFIVPIVGAIIVLALMVCELICVYNVFTNQVREAPIIRSLNFLK